MSTSRPSRLLLCLLCVTHLLASCASKEEKAPPPIYDTRPSLATDPGASRSGDPLEAAVAGISLMFSAAQERKASKRVPMITGHCKVIFPPSDDGDRPERLCNDAYVLVRGIKSRSESRVWMDGRGEFEVRMSPGESYELVAVFTLIQLESKPLRVTRPGRVTLQIDLRKEDDAEAKPASKAVKQPDA